MSWRAKQAEAYKRHKLAVQRLVADDKQDKEEKEAAEKARFLEEQPRRDVIRGKALRDTKGWTGEYKEAKNRR